MSGREADKRGKAAKRGKKRQAAECYIDRLPSELLSAIIVSCLSQQPVYGAQTIRRTICYVNKAWNRACRAIAFRRIYVDASNRTDLIALHRTVAASPGHALEIEEFDCSVRFSTEAEDEIVAEILAGAGNLRAVRLLSASQCPASPPPPPTAEEFEFPLNKAAEALLDQPGLRRLCLPYAAVKRHRLRSLLDVNQSLRQFKFLDVTGERKRMSDGSFGWRVTGERDPMSAAMIAAIGPEISALGITTVRTDPGRSLSQIHLCTNLRRLDAPVPWNNPEAHLTTLCAIIKPLPLEELNLTLSAGGRVPSQASVMLMSEFMAKPTWSSLTLDIDYDRVDHANWILAPADMRRVLKGQKRTDRRRSLCVSHIEASDDDDEEEPESPEQWSRENVAALVKLANSRNIDLRI